MTSLHLTAEDLSAYLDEALPPAGTERVERHLADCEPCRRHLGGLRRTVAGLRHLERQAPPDALGQMVARRVAFERTRPKLSDRFEQSFEILERQSPLLVLFALVIALAVIILFFAQALEERRNAGSPVIFQDPPATAAPPAADATTDAATEPASQTLAGRRLQWTGARWLEAGVDPDAPARRVELGTADGEAWLAVRPELDAVRELTAPVRIEIDGEIVEISPAVPNPSAALE